MKNKAEAMVEYAIEVYNHFKTTGEWITKPMFKGSNNIYIEVALNYFTKEYNKERKWKFNKK